MISVIAASGIYAGENDPERMIKVTDKQGQTLSVPVAPAEKFIATKFVNGTDNEIALRLHFRNENAIGGEYTPIDGSHTEEYELTAHQEDDLPVQMIWNSAIEFKDIGLLLESISFVNGVNGVVSKDLTKDEMLSLNDGKAYVKISSAAGEPTINIVSFASAAPEAPKY